MSWKYSNSQSIGTYHRYKHDTKMGFTMYVIYKTFTTSVKLLGHLN